MEIYMVKVEDNDNTDGAIWVFTDEDAAEACYDGNMPKTQGQSVSLYKGTIESGDPRQAHLFYPDKSSEM